MKVTWVPSKKAIAQGIVPSDYTIYDIDTDIDPIPDASVEIMLKRAYRHMFNNEARSNVDAAIAKGKEATPPVLLDRTELLHKYRVDQRNKILEGKLGMREAAVAQVYDEVTTEARSIAYARARKHIETKSKGTILLGDMTPRSLAKEFEGKTVEAWIAELLDETKSRNAAKFWADARENVAKRHEQAAAADESDDDVFGSTDEDESEEEDADAAA